MVTLALLVLLLKLTLSLLLPCCACELLVLLQVLYKRESTGYGILIPQ
jgi:hypothetical protein